jgi:RNA polymerase sigma factor (sigma-70 family)
LLVIGKLMMKTNMSPILQLIRRSVEDQRDQQLTDQELLCRFRTQRDEAAFHTLLRRHGSMVLDVCRNVLANEADAEDAFQATFLILAQKAGAIRNQASVGSWLHGVAYRTALKARAGSAKRKKHEARVPSQPSSGASDELTWREIQQVIHEELSKVAECYRAPLVLCYLEGKTQVEAAKALGVSAATVNKRLEQGRARLRARLVRCGLGSAAVSVTAAWPLGATASAQLPAVLVAGTVRAAQLFAAGNAVTAVVSAKVAALVEGVMKTMLLTKITTVAAVFLMLGAVVFGGTLLSRQVAAAHHGQAETQLAEEKRADPPRPKVEQRPEALTDRNGDRLPEGAIARLGTARWRHGGKVQSVTFGPDGKTLASASWDGSVRLWEAGTGRELATFPDRGYGVSALGVAYAPNGKILASCENDKTIHLWDVATHKEIRTLLGHEDRVWSVVWAPDGQTIATASYDKTVRLWDPATGKELHTLRGHEIHVQYVAYAPDSKTIASAGCDNTVRLWDVATGKELRTLDGHKLSVHSVAFAPDGKTLASASMDGTIRLWEVASGKEIRVFDGNQGWVLSVAWAPDGKTLASAGEDKTVRLWDAATGKELGTLRGHHDSVQCVAYAPDGKTLASAGDTTVRVWNVDTRKEILPLSGHQSGVFAAVCSPDGKTVASGGEDGTIRLWDVATCKELRTLGGHQGGVTSVVYAPDGRTLMSGGLDKTIRLWDTATGRELRSLPCQGLVPSVVYAPDNKTPASVVSYGETLRLWDAATDGEPYTLRGHEGWISAVAYAPDGKTLVSVSQDKSIRHWEASTGRQIHAVVGLQSYMTSVAYAPNGKTMAFGNWDGTIRLWEVASWKEIWSSPGGKGWMGNVVFSPDGKVLASVLNGRTIMLWDVVTGKRISSFTGHTTSCWKITFTPDGKRLVSANMDTTVLLWDLPAPPPVEHLSPELATQELNALWKDLKGDDAPRAYRAVWTLGANPQQAVPFLRQRLRPVPLQDTRRIATLIADLDSATFSEREKATQELEKLGELARSALTQALKNQPSPEARHRMEPLLAKFDGPVTAPEQLQNIRSLEVLEYVNTAEALAVLKGLAEGEPEARLTLDAKAALDRLAKQQRSQR